VRKRGSKKSKKPGDEEGRWVNPRRPIPTLLKRLVVGKRSVNRGWGRREKLTLNDLRNVVTIDLHFIALLIFVTDKAGIIIHGGLPSVRIMRPSLVAMT
jgi:hypothetical protein